MAVLPDLTVKGGDTRHGVIRPLWYSGFAGRSTQTLATPGDTPSRAQTPRYTDSSNTWRSVAGVPCPSQGALDVPRRTATGILPRTAAWNHPAKNTRQAKGRTGISWTGPASGVRSVSQKDVHARRRIRWALRILSGNVGEDVECLLRILRICLDGSERQQQQGPAGTATYRLISNSSSTRRVPIPYRLRSAEPHHPREDSTRRRPGADRGAGIAAKCESVHRLRKLQVLPESETAALWDR